VPEIIFTVDENGDTSLKIKGVKGSACKPIHAAVSADLAKALGVAEVKADDTSEMREKPPTYTTTQTVRAR